MALESTGGRQTFYGQLPTVNKHGGKIATKGSIKEIKHTFKFDDLPGADSGNVMNIAIPAGAKIVAADMRVDVAWVGGTNLTTGLVDLDGTANDPDGLHAAIVTAALTLGSLHVGGGALIGAVGDATAAQTMIAVTTGTYTAGESTIVIQYQPLNGDAA